MYIYTYTYIYIYISPNHFAVHLKLTQYCESTILLSIKKKKLLSIFYVSGTVLGTCDWIKQMKISAHVKFTS